MLTFSSLGGSGIRITGGAIVAAVFPEKPVAASINLLPVPEEGWQEGVVSWPGEYDYNGVTVRGIGQQDGQQVSYLVEADDVRCAFPSSPLQEWKDEDIERLGGVHILVLPAENPKVSQKLLEDVDPRMLILVPDAKGNMDPEVLKACGATGKEHVSEIKVKGSFPAEGREVVVFGKEL